MIARGALHYSKWYYSSIGGLEKQHPLLYSPYIPHKIIAKVKNLPPAYVHLFGYVLPGASVYVIKLQRFALVALAGLEKLLTFKRVREILKKYEAGEAGK